MTAKILQFPKVKQMKKIDPQLLKLMMRNHKLIASLRKRKFTATAIAKSVLAAEESRR